MRFRQLPGALILGLLASLAAHFGVYGGGHVEGGAFHALLQIVALAGGGFGLFALAVAAFGCTGRCAQGSVVASCLASWLPDTPAIAASGVAWFGLIESLEPAHSPASLMAILAAILVAALAVHVFGRALLRAIAEFAVAISRHAFAPRRPASRLRTFAAPVFRARFFAPRLVTRPPPSSLFAL